MLRRGNGATHFAGLNAVLALALVGCTWSDGAAERASSDRPSEVDVGFSQDMAVHHAQAVDMADRIRSRTDDPRLRTLATDIVLTQQAQIGRMQGWLELWGEPLTSTSAPMRWAGRDDMGMDHATDQDDHMMAMPGIAAPSEIAALDTLDPATAERRFLELMIEHHLGGVEMAERALELDPSGVVARLARAIVEGQRAEIDVLREMLDERGAAS